MTTRRSVLAGIGAAAATAGCARNTDPNVLTMWGMGREAEVVSEVLPGFLAEHPGVRVDVQMLPWTAAHERLLTAFVGNSLPDIAQLGNTWIPEFSSLNALEPLAPLLAATPSIDQVDYFEGIWNTNMYGGELYGIPWYVDTRVLFYRADILRQAGYAQAPRTWAEWRETMEKIRSRPGAAYSILLPTNEWEQLTILGLQRDSPLLSGGGRHGDFSGAAFREAADWYVGLYRDRLAPVVSYTQVGNPYQEFARGYFAMWITGPWNLGEFRRRLSPEQQDLWMTAPLPAPDASSAWPGVSFAGGSSLAIFRASPRAEAAWRFAEYLAEPEVQSKFYALAGDLPARREAWDAPPLAGDAKAAAFRTQLTRVEPLPRVPEWEQIAQKIPEDLEAAIRGRQNVAASLAALDADVDRILEKRRWLLARAEAKRGR